VPGLTSSAKLNVQVSGPCPPVGGKDPVVKSFIAVSPSFIA